MRRLGCRYAVALLCLGCARGPDGSASPEELSRRDRDAPDGYHLDGSFQPEIGDGPAWAHPVIHHGRLYLRHDNLLLCYDLRSRQ